LFQRALLPPFLRLLEKALYRACVPTLGSMRRPVVVKIYSGSPDQEQFRDSVEDSKNATLANATTHV
jgi:hypothetical protein